MALDREQKLWKRIIFDKYGIAENGWSTKPCSRSHGVGFWKGLMLCKDFFDEHAIYLVGNGEKVRFSEVRWLGNVRLKEMFPGLFEVSRKKLCKVNEVLTQEANGWTWNIKPRRRLSEREIEEVTGFTEMLENVTLTGEDDSRFWGEVNIDLTANKVL